jgi:hypothetical protein
VIRRWKRLVGQNQVEVVSYEVEPGGVVFQVWAPPSFYSIGEEVQVPVCVRVFQGKAGASYSLQMPTRAGEF